MVRKYIACPVRKRMTDTPQLVEIKMNVFQLLENIPENKSH